MGIGFEELPHFLPAHLSGLWLNGRLATVDNGLVAVSSGFEKKDGWQEVEFPHDIDDIPVLERVDLFTGPPLSRSHEFPHPGPNSPFPSQGHNHAVREQE
jgi:hypothetical protein